MPSEDATNEGGNGIVYKSSNKMSEGNYKLKIFQTSINLLAHIFIGIVIGVILLFCFRGGVPMSSLHLHIVLCALGYQLLMSQAILSLCSHNSWSTHLRFVDKRRAHWILQIMGSSLAIAGSVLIIKTKTVHWNTLHGQFGLVALVFTIASLVNGLTSLYAYEWRRIVPGNISKISHICFGIVAYVASCISLCYGFDYAFFKNWASLAVTHTIMAFTAGFTFIIIVNPAITFYDKSMRLIKK